MEHSIALIPGDGIGPDVVRKGVLDATGGILLMPNALPEARRMTAPEHRCRN